MDIYDDFILSIMKKEIDFIFKLFKDVIEYWFVVGLFFIGGGYYFPFIGGGCLLFSFFFYCLKNAPDFKAEPVLKISLDDLLTR